MTARGADTLTNVRIEFPITFSVIGTLVLLGLTFWFWDISDSAKETLIFFSAGIVALANTAAAFYTARTLNAALRSERDSAERNQLIDEREERFENREKDRDSFRIKMYSMEFGKRWNDPGMFHVRDTIREIYKKHEDGEDLKDFIEQRQTNVIHCINFLEEMATACKSGLADEEILRNQFDHITVSIWKKLYPWIEIYREKRGNKRIWEDLEWSYDRWKK
ncbi:MAG TPA: DUF4760 domain-containing protein [Xanthobacteraceae bacterium]|nr:DUF4760 domain-containing protein [Xanthobacteraceae bacterium]